MMEASAFHRQRTELDVAIVGTNRQSATAATVRSTSRLVRRFHGFEDSLIDTHRPVARVNLDGRVEGRGQCRFDSAVITLDGDFVVGPLDGQLEVSVVGSETTDDCSLGHTETSVADQGDVVAPSLDRWGLSRLGCPAHQSGDNGVRQPATDATAHETEEGSDTQNTPTGDDPERDSGERPCRHVTGRYTDYPHRQRAHGDCTTDETSAESGRSRVCRAEYSDDSREKRSEEHDAATDRRRRVRQSVEEGTDGQRAQCAHECISPRCRNGTPTKR